MSYIEPHMKKELENHSLKEVVSAGGIKAFRMRRPETSNYSAMIVFSPVGIIIAGDIILCEETGGVVSHSRHYDLKWFAGALSETYLCEKFLRKKWQSEVAQEWLKDYIEDVKAGNQEGDVEKLSEVLGDMENHGEMSPDAWHDAMQAAGYEFDGEFPGSDYPRAEAGWLCAIHQRFRELYAAERGGKEG